jgi:outer membrane protein
MKIKLTGLILLMSIVSSSLFAQQQLTLSVQEAVDHALKYNRTLMNSGLAVDKAQQGLRAAIANGLPQVNATVDYSNALGAEMSIKFMEGAPETKIPIKPTSNLKVQVTQMIFNGSYIVGVQTAKLYKELSEISLQKSEADIRTQVMNSYYLVQVSVELNNKLNQNLINLRELHKKVEALVYVGIKEQTDADQLFIQLNTLQNAVNASERQVELTTNMLRLQLGTDINTQLVLTDNIDMILDQSDSEKALLQTLKLDNNLDFRLMDEQVQISRKMVDLKKSAALPSIGGFYSYTYKLLTSNFDMAAPHMLGLQMNIPIFSSGVRNAQTKQAFLDLKTTQNNRDMISDQLRIQDKQLRFNLINATETYSNQKANIEVSRRVYSNLKLKFEQGLISGLDLITADNNYLKAETDYISAALQLLDARLELDKMYITAN